MAKIKYYAIKTSFDKIIVSSWLECEQLVKGVKGVLYKSFSTEIDAKNWLYDVKESIPEGILIYVDGSFTPKFPKAGWSFVVTENDEEISRGFGITSFDAESRNIDGEVMASFQAMKWLDKHNKNGTICYDYEGISKWALGEWNAKSSIALQYVNAIQPYLNRVTFKKIVAHSGNKWNELADVLAKEAIKNAQNN